VLEEPYQSRPSPRSSRQDEDESPGRGRSGTLHFQSISEPTGSETSAAVDGIREQLKEFGTNSGPNFHASPNAGIQIRILEFLILDLILYIQTRC
jgi:hypothetical protein